MYERHRKWRYSNNLDLFSPKMLSWELTEYSLLFETSLEADFDLGGHQNEVGGLFLQNMFERHTNWRYPISLCHFELKMRSPDVTDYAMRRSNRSFWLFQTIYQCFILFLFQTISDNLRLFLTISDYCRLFLTIYD